MASAEDVAAAILERTGPVSTMKLQKLVYYSQAWALAWRDEPLFLEPIEAWRDGPAVRRLFKKHRGSLWVGCKSFPEGSPERLPAWAGPIIDFVSGYYGRMSAADLRGMTHNEEPWAQARRRADLEEGDLGSVEVQRDEMRDYYRTQDPYEQGWYWTEEWQAGEREALADIEAGRVTTYQSDDEFLASLR